MEQWKETYNTGWSDWEIFFPDPRKGEYINAPLGAECISLGTRKLIDMFYLEPVNIWHIG